MENDEMLCIDDNEHLCRHRHSHILVSCKWVEKFAFMNNSKRQSNNTQEHCYTLFFHCTCINGKQSMVAQKATFRCSKCGKQKIVNVKKAKRE